MEYVKWIINKFGAKEGYLRLIRMLLVFLLIDATGTGVHQGWNYGVFITLFLFLLVLFGQHMASKNDILLLDPVAMFLLTCFVAIGSVSAVLDITSTIGIFVALLSMPFVVLYALWVFVLQKEMLPGYDGHTWFVPTKKVEK